MKYISNFNHNGFSFDVGSDWHFSLKEKNTPDALIARIKKEKVSDTLFQVGDIFDTSEGENSEKEIIYLLKNLAKIYSNIVFSPGNHDLRGRNNPYYDFIHGKIASNVFVADQYSTLQVRLEGKNILLGNIFYDMEFLDTGIIGLSKEDVEKFYKEETTDGKHLFGGDYSQFKKMTQAVKESLSNKIDILVTHTLPHPSLVTFRVPESNDEIKSLSEKLGIPFICNQKEDEEQSKRYNGTAETYRWYWNLKSFIMGSDVLSGNSSIKDDLICIYGHNHRSNDSYITVSDKKIRFVSHQPNPWYEKFDLTV